MKRTWRFRLKRIAIWLGRAALVGVVVVMLLLALIWRERRQPLELPIPTGPFAVGRATCVWSDATQADSFAPQPGTKRELLAWVWYPAVARESPTTFEDYMPAPLRTAIERQRVALINFITRDFSKVHAHSIRNSNVSPQQPSYPVVFMIGSLGFTTLAEDLASHGYVVVSVEAPYRSGLVVFPDGRVIAQLPQNNPETLAGSQKEQLAIKLQSAASADISFALDQLERLNASDPSGKFQGRLDLTRVAVFGHSLGGAIALQFCHDDSRCQAVIDVDGAPHGNVIGEGVTKPLMFLLSDHSRESDSVSRDIKANVRSILDRLPSDRRLQIMIAGANHFSFGDDAVLKSHFVRGALRKLGVLRIDGRRQVVVTAYCIHSFFDVYLKGAPNSGLKSQPEYPEIQVVE